MDGVLPSLGKTISKIQANFLTKGILCLHGGQKNGKSIQGGSFPRFV